MAAKKRMGNVVFEPVVLLCHERESAKEGE